MSEVKTAAPVSLEAKSPYELRVNQSRDVPENIVKTALATGDVGFLHSFTTGSAVDGLPPGEAEDAKHLCGWTAGVAHHQRLRLPIGNAQTRRTVIVRRATGGQ